MPRNTVAGLTSKEIRNLIAFVASNGATPNYDEIMRLEIPDVSAIEAERVDVSMAQMVQAEKVMRGTGRCLECHSIHDRPEDRVFAPSLFGAGLKDSELIRESIVHPHKDVSPVYSSVQVVLTNGKIVSGQLLSRNDEELTLFTVDAENHPQRRVIPLQEVDEEDGELLILESQQSIMPGGFEELLSADEMKAVVALIRQLNE